MTVKTGQAWAGSFVTLDATGAVTAATGTPTGTLYVDGTANGASVTISGSNPYKWSVTLPSLTAGQRCDMYITATIASIATAGFVASEQADTALLSDGVAVASIANDAITAAALKADAVTEIQNGLALEATLTAIKGIGWDNGTLQNIKNDIESVDSKLDTVDDFLDTEIAAILADTNELQTDLIDGGRLDLLIDSIITHLTQIKGTGWTDETMVSLQALIDEIKAKTDQLAFTVPNKVDATAPTDTSSIAGDVWSHATRTLTVPAVAAAATEDGTTLTLYKDADINIEFTGLTIPTGAKKVVFTIKDNLDDADTAAALQATYQLTDVPAETHTLNYINSAVPPVLTTPVTFTVDTDSVEFDMTAAAAYYLPRYERGYLKWDLKLITATTVQILQQGLVQILGTSTRTVA